MSLGSQVRKYRKLKGWTLDDLAERAGVGRGTIGALENRDSNRSDFTSQLASAFGLSVEQLVDESRNWLEDANFKVAEPGGAEYIGRAPAQHLVAVTGLAQLGENGWYAEITAPGAEGYVEAVSSDADAYVLRVKGDSMHPAIRDGWYVLVEPNRQPHAGAYAAIKLADGRRMVKEFLFRTSDTLVVESVNGGARLTLRLEEIETIHPIGAVLMPDKHREI